MLCQFLCPPAAAGLTATGGVISDYAVGSDVYRAHVFTSTGALNVTALGDFPASVEVGCPLFLLPSTFSWRR